MAHKHVTPHDAFFRSAMTNPTVVREFFTQHLPPDVKDRIDFSTIKAKKESFIDDKLRLQISDLLFSAEFNHRTGYLYLLVEHQSTQQKIMPFRMLKYIISIMEQHIKSTGESRLPIV